AASGHPCGRSAPRAERRRSGRPASGFPDAGTESRGQYGRIEGFRDRNDQRRGRAEVADRADARADPEPGMSGPSAAATGSAPGEPGAAGVGQIFVVAAPSGAGKSILVRALLQRDPSIRLSVSFTTRAPRPGETHGREYTFVSPEEFAARKAGGEFLEAAEVHGNWY